MTSSVKLHYGKGEHALTYYNGEAYVTTPLRIARRSMMAFGITMSLHNAQEDCSTMAINHNWHDMDRFLMKCQVKFDLSLKVYTMFGGAGLVH